MRSFKTFYNLSCNPFEKSMRVTNCFESNDEKIMMDRLNYLKEVRGIGVFTAAPGMGKTYCLRCFEHSLPKNLCEMKYICLSTVSVGEFYKQFCEQLGLPQKGGKTVMFKAIQERIYYLFKEKKKPLILAIDEAQYLSNSILKDLKMILNFEFDSVNCFTLILCGEPHLNNTLEMPVHEALKQRITTHYAFEGLSGDETAEYIRHKIKTAGGSPDIIDDAAINAIKGYSNGNPRLIDNVMTDALIYGAQLDKSIIDNDVILAAVNEQALT